MYAHCRWSAANASPIPHIRIEAAAICGFPKMPHTTAMTAANMKNNIRRLRLISPGAKSYGQPEEQGDRDTLPVQFFAFTSSVLPAGIRLYQVQHPSDAQPQERVL